MLEKLNNNKGMSYVEVVICLVIVAIVILPLSHSFVSSTKIREDAESLNQSTFYAETLLEETKLQLEKDLMEARDPLNISSPAYYLDTTTDPAIRTSPTNLTVFLDTTTNPSLRISQNYDTTRYAYEVALWNMKDVITSGGTISFDQAPSAVKFYTDANYQSTSGTTLQKLPQFKIDEVNKTFFQNELFLKSFLPTATGSPSSISGVGKLKLTLKGDGNLDDPVITSYGDITISNTGEIAQSTSEGKGLIYNITRAVSTIGTGVVIVDTRAVNMSKITTAGTLKFNNHTNFPMLLKILVTKSDAAQLDNKINIILSDSNIEGKTTIERITELDEEEDYLIAVIVRDKKPRLGKPGKIVKTMMDIYSFESMSD